MSINESTAGFRNHAGWVPGDHLNFEPFNIRIALDEDFAGYTEIFNWLKSHTEDNDLKVADITLIVLSSHNNTNKSFRFVNAFPTTLGSIEFNVQNTDIEYAYTDVTFRYDYFEIDGEPIC